MTGKRGRAGQNMEVQVIIVHYYVMVMSFSHKRRSRTAPPKIAVYNNKNSTLGDLDFVLTTYSILFAII
jgi:hypothetical protein